MKISNSGPVIGKCNLKILVSDPYLQLLTNTEATGIKLLLGQYAKPNIPLKVAGTIIEYLKQGSDYFIQNWPDIEAVLRQRQEYSNYVLVKDRDSLNQYLVTSGGIFYDLSKVEPKPGYSKEVYGLRFIALTDSEGCFWALDLNQIRELLRIGKNSAVKNSFGEDFCLPILGYHNQLGPDEIAIAYSVDDLDTGYNCSLLKSNSAEEKSKNDLIHSLLLSEIVSYTRNRNSMQIEDFSQNALFTIQISWHSVSRSVDILLRETDNKYVFAIKTADYHELNANLNPDDIQPAARITSEYLPAKHSFAELLPADNEILASHVAWKISNQIYLSPCGSGLLSHLDREIILKIPTDYWQLFYHTFSEAESDAYRRMKDSYPDSISFKLKVVRSKRAAELGKHGSEWYYQDCTDPGLILAFSEDKHTLQEKLSELLPVVVHTHGLTTSQGPDFLRTPESIDLREIELSEESLAGLIWHPEILISRIKKKVGEKNGEIDHMAAAYDNFIELPGGETVLCYMRLKREAEQSKPVTVIKMRDLIRLCDAFDVEQQIDTNLLKDGTNKVLRTLSMLDAAAHPTSAVRYFCHTRRLGVDENSLMDIRDCIYDTSKNGWPTLSSELYPESESLKIYNISADLDANNTPTGYIFRIRGTVSECNYVEIKVGDFYRLAIPRNNHFDITIPSPRRPTECTVIPIHNSSKGKKHTFIVNGYNPASESEELSETIEIMMQAESHQNEATQTEIEKYFIKYFVRNFDEGLEIINDCRPMIDQKYYKILDQLRTTFEEVQNIKSIAELDFIQKYSVYKAYKAFRSGKKCFILPACRKEDKTKVALALAELIGDALIISADRSESDWQNELSNFESKTANSKSGLKNFSMSETGHNSVMLSLRSDTIPEHAVTAIIWDEPRSAQPLSTEHIDKLFKQTGFILFTSDPSTKLLRVTNQILEVAGVLPESLKNIEDHEYSSLIEFSEIIRSNGLFLNSTDICFSYSGLADSKFSKPSVLIRKPHEFRLSEAQSALLKFLMADPREFCTNFRITGNYNDVSLIMRIYREIINNTGRFEKEQNSAKLLCCDSIASEKIQNGDRMLIYVANTGNAQLLANHFSNKGLRVAYYGENLRNAPFRYAYEVRDVLDSGEADISILILKGQALELEFKNVKFRLFFDLPDNLTDFEHLCFLASNNESEFVSIDTIVPDDTCFKDPNDILIRPKNYSFEKKLWYYYQSYLQRIRLYQHGFSPPGLLDDNLMTAREIFLNNPER